MFLSVILGSVNTGTLILVALAIVIAFYLYYLDKKEKKSDPTAALCEKYRVLTADTLNTLSDTDLLRAVAANLLDKQDKSPPNPTLTLSGLSQGRRTVYGIWVLCHELDQTGNTFSLTESIGRCADFAAEGFSLLGLNRCLAALTDLMTAGRTGSPAALREAVAAEQPLAACVTYIRENPAEFIDL